MYKSISIIVPYRETESVEPLLRHIQALSSVCGAVCVELITVCGNQPAAQRNAAVRECTGDLVYFLDNDAFPAEQNISLLMRFFDITEGLACMGGPSLAPPDASPLQQVFQYVLGSFLATAWMCSRYRATGRPRVATDRELILCNLAIRKDVFNALGGFNERLYPNEENELMDRMRIEGYTLMYHPEFVVYREPRASWSAFIRQFSGYGRGRSEQMRQAFRWGNLPIFVFACFPPVFTGLCIAGIFLPLLAVLPGVYALFCLAAALPMRRVSVRAIGQAVCGFFVCHFFYGLGMWRGLFGKLRSSGLKAEYSMQRVDLPGTGGIE